MSLDERIQALTQTAELMAQIHRDNERRYEQRFNEIDGRGAKTDARIDRLIDVVERLAEIVQSHERRLNNLEQ